MTEEPRKNTKTQVALTLARGVSINTRTRANEVPKRTAYRWSKDPNVRKAVESCRRRSIDRAVGLMTRRATWVVGRITKLADSAESESVRLTALRSMFSDMIAVSKYSGLEGRLVEIEELAQRAGLAEQKVESRE